MELKFYSFQFLILGSVSLFAISIVTWYVNREFAKIYNMISGSAKIIQQLSTMLGEDMAKLHDIDKRLTKLEKL